MKTAQNKIACVTGATSGIGAAFAEEFAKQNFNLIITGRRKSKINDFANRLKELYNIQVHVIIADFTDDNAATLLANKLNKLNNLEVLVNNAGYGSEGFFYQEKSGAQIAKINVSNSTTVKLCHAVLPKMISKGIGTIINVSSLSACFPAPGASMYSATRAFLVSFTESIYLELQESGVKVQVLCPGTTKTDFHEKLGFDPGDYYKSKGLHKILTAKQVVNSSIKSLKKNKVICIPGILNRFSWMVFKYIPRRLTYKIVRIMMKKRECFKRISLSQSKPYNYHLAC